MLNLMTANMVTDMLHVPYIRARNATTTGAMAKFLTTFRTPAAPVSGTVELGLGVEVEEPDPEPPVG